MINKLLKTLKACSAQIDDSELLLALEETEELFEKLKPVVPQCVAEWFEEKKEDGLEELWGDLSYRDAPTDVLTHFEDTQYDDIFILLTDMYQFGYTIKPDKRYRIKAPNLWNLRNDGRQCIYLRKWENKIGYDLAFDSSATTYTKQEAKELMKRLKVDWELEEVEGDGE